MIRVDSIGDPLAQKFCFDPKTFVDVGCGTGDLERWLSSTGACAIGVASPARIQRAAAARRGSER